MIPMCGSTRAFAAEVLIAASVLLAAEVSAAESAEGIADDPPGRVLSLPATTNLLSLPQLGPDELVDIEDLEREVNWSGITRSVPPDEMGRVFGADGGGWTHTSSGPVWRLRLTSPHARALRVFFQDMALDTGRLWIYSGSDPVLGPYTGGGPYGDGEFWCPLVRGETVSIEFQPSIEAVSTGRLSLPFRITRIGHLWHLPDALEGESPGEHGKLDDLSVHGPGAGLPRTAQIPRRWTEAATGDATVGRLALVRPNGFRLSAREVPTVYIGARSYQFEVRDGVESIGIQLRSNTPRVNLGLFVSFGRDNEVVDGRVVSDYRSEVLAGDVAILISRSSDPPLKTGTYFLSLGLDGNVAEADGTITISPRATIDNCYQDAACRTGADEDIDNFASAIALISFVDDETKRLGYCSGALINDKVNDSWIPYFVTAAHCVSTESEARSVEAHWFYQNRTCGGAPSRVLDSRYSQTAGARLVAVEDGSVSANGRINAYGLGDIALLRLLESPSGAWFLGWQAGSGAIAVGTNVMGIHHAEAKTKQISFGEIESRLSNMLYVEWGNGLTLVGASGSPLLNEEGHILGVLSGGRDDHEGCFDQGSPTLYSTLRSFYPKIRGYLEGEDVPPPSGNSDVVVGGPLVPATPSRFRLAPASSRSLLSGEHSYYVDVPAGATGLTLTLVSDTPSVDIDLYVRYAADNSDTQYDWSSTGPSGNETIEVELGSNRAIRPGRYYVSLLLYDSPSAAVGGTLTATLTMGNSGIATDATGIQFVTIRSGSFAMGSRSSEAYPHERPLTQVTISRAFEMSKFEVTQGQWESVMGSNPSWDSACGPTCPVESVSWNDTQEFLTRLNAVGDGYEYRLPTEAEWEYAARASTTSDRHGALDEIAWHVGNSGNRIHPVGLKAANRFGLHDMIGNVYEWVGDWYGAYPGGTVTDPLGPTSGSQRVARGGSKHHGARANRASHRYRDSVDKRYSDAGFRVVRVSETPPVGGVLQPGEPRRFLIPPSQAGKLLNGEQSFVLDVPTGAASLTLTLTSDDPEVDVDLYVRYQVDAQRTQYDWRAVGTSGNEEIEIRHDSRPPLQAGRYYVSLLLYRSSGAAASGTLTASVTRSAAVTAGIEFVGVPAGSFTMGSRSVEAYSDERPLTRVRISDAFALGKHEVTQGQWQAIMGSNPSWDSACGPTCPVESVSWNDTQEFLARLNAQSDGYTYRLPTEAEWEYAARAGMTGDRYGPLDEIAWHIGNSGDRIHRVGLKASNPFGLHDMIGNVYELVQDRYGVYPGGTVTDPAGPTSGSERVIRGGSKHNDRRANRATGRNRISADERYSNVGLRVLRIRNSGAGSLLGGRLEFGEPKAFRIPANEFGRLQNGARSFFVQVPSGASRLTVVLASDDPGIDVDLFVRYQADNSFLTSDWASQSLSGNERLVIGLDRPLRAGKYYISLMLFDVSSVPASGTITATLSW